MWSPSNNRRLHRKLVPDGSDDFQRVLDDFLDEYKTDQNNNGQDQLVGEEDIVHSNDINQYSNIDNKGRGVDYFVDSSDSKRHTSHGENIRPNNAIKNAWHSGSIDSCTSSTLEPPLIVLNDDIQLYDCHGNAVSFERTSSAIDPLRLPDINSKTTDHFYSKDNINHYHIADMGNTCSSKFHGSREWHGVTSGSGAMVSLTRPRPKSLTFRAESSNGGLHSPDKSSHCTCIALHNNDLKSSPVSHSPDCSPNTASGRLPRSVQNERVTKLRATVKCDVSPHRLSSPTTGRAKNHNHLTFSSHPSHPSNNNNNDEMRTRSHSWSNGKQGTKAAIISPKLAKSSKIAAHSHSSSKTMGCLPGLSSSPKRETRLMHEPGCQLYDPRANLLCRLSPRSTSDNKDVAKDVAKDATKDAADSSDDDLKPMMRRRAVSESYKSRHKRTTDQSGSSGCVADDMEQGHVHWADEERGHALSTSVFLNSIRPRSHSHSAMDSPRTRSILRKRTQT